MDSLKHENWINVCRGIGILIVMLGHSGPSPWLNKAIDSFHMPLFFILSGYLFKVNQSLGTRECIYKNWKRYIVPYFGYVSINLMIQMVRLWIGKEEQLLKSFFVYVGGGVYSRGSMLCMPNCSPLWYLTCIFCAVVMLNAITQKLREKAYIAVIGFSVVTAVLSFAEAPKLPWNIDTAMAGVTFMYMGILLKKYSLISRYNNVKYVKKIGLSLLLLIIWGLAAFLNPIAAVSFNNNRYGNYFLMLIAAAAASFLLIAVCREVCNRFENMGKLKPFFKLIALFGTNTIFIMAFDYLSGDIARSILSSYNGYKAYWLKKVIIMFVALVIFCGIKKYIGVIKDEKNKISCHGC
ncbi:acyltransferase family protein [Lacrimispora sp. 210928-DFI.3.58]|uniref:acyltransferase family protein n=1 Tax=Lacrimispora sp. 210928-DFI.3.58 TaxID=2883214 RepID=UPI001D08E586|nr:acyltransferase family protein [Lacrimispora sp. 210928-DFI.3.58]MCB7319560.1 acyltransferase family protein [Lacrimispora sp. 210928-DFI.3.58]